MVIGLRYLPIQDHQLFLGDIALTDENDLKLQPFCNFQSQYCLCCLTCPLSHVCSGSKKICNLWICDRPSLPSEKINKIV